MQRFEFNILNKSKLKSCLLLLLLFAFCSQPELGHTQEALNNKITFKQIDTSIQNILVLHNNNNKLHLYIIKHLNDLLVKKHPSTKIITRKNLLRTKKNKIDLIIAIGLDNIKKAIKNFPDKNKLFISSSPGTYQINNHTEENASIFYMTQPFCRQLKFISLLNKKWEKVGILSTDKKNINIKKLQDCVSKYQLKIVQVSISEKTDLAKKVKQVVTHSDTLLALPDKDIYNSQTVKNILLTSYRYRKPVIAFSKNFSKSGALASIYSSKKQITDSIVSIIGNYLNSNNQFNKKINYPEDFSISINKQVAKALNMKTPDLSTIEESIQKYESRDPGNIQ